MTHARVCTCCGGQPGDRPCPGEAGYCVRVTLSGFTPTPSCRPPVESGDLAEITSLAIDGVVPLNGFANAHIGYRSVNPAGSPWATATNYIQTQGAVTCSGGRPTLVDFRVLPGTSDVFGLSLDAPIFIATPRIIDLSEGPVSPDNLVSCPQAITNAGAATIEVYNDPGCSNPVPRRIEAVDCGAPNNTIIVDPLTNTQGHPGIKLGQTLYRPVRRVNGPPQAVTWVDEVCEAAESDLRAPGDQGPGGLWAWGTLVRQAIDLLTAHKIRHCNSCQRRQLILDHMGESIGKRVADFLGL